MPSDITRETPKTPVTLRRNRTVLLRSMKFRALLLANGKSTERTLSILTVASSRGLRLMIFACKARSDFEIFF